MSALLTATLAVLDAGCGPARPARDRAVSVLVTRGYGTVSIARRRLGRARASIHLTAGQTAGAIGPDRLSGGRAIVIDGVAARPGERWSAYLNGVSAGARPASAAVADGDSVWWDLRAAASVGDPLAVVGSYPEPFRSGVAGKRLPVVLTCAPDAGGACERLAGALQIAGIPVARQGLGTGSGPDTLAIVVGRFSALAGQIDAALLDRGPSASGVYARFTGPGASQLQLLDASGGVARTLGPGAGLVAAVRDRISEPTWLVTGTDGSGVIAAARAVTPARLRGRYALATTSGADTPLPVVH